MALPTKRTPAKGDISSLMVAIYGVTGIGKTTFCHRFGEILFLPTDPGLGHLDAYRWNDQEIIASWEELWMAFNELKAAPGQFAAVCLDNLTNAHRLAATWIMRTKGVSHETDLGGENDNSKGYSMVNREFLRYLAALRSLGIGLYLTAHEREHQIIDNKVKVTKIGPDITTSVMKQIVGTCDFVLYGHPIVTKEEEGEGDDKLPVIKTRHVMRTKPSEKWIAKDRFNVLPPTMDLNFHLFRKNFIEGMKKKAGEAPEDTVTPEPKKVVAPVAERLPEKAVAPAGKQNEASDPAVAAEEKKDMKPDPQPDTKQEPKADTKPDTKPAENQKK
jgi:hypothetical protein